MFLPAVTPLPSFDICKILSKDDLRTSLKSWELVVQEYLRLPAAQFQEKFETSSLKDFLISYVDFSNKNSNSVLQNSNLRKYMFLVAHRALTDEKEPSHPLLECTFLGDLCRVYQKNKSLESLLEHIWRTRNFEIKRSLEAVKVQLSQRFAREDWSSEDDSFCSHRLLPLIHTLPAVGTIFAIGSDFIDSLATAYMSILPTSQPQVLLLAYMCLTSPLRETTVNESLCLDQLFGLKSTAASQTGSATLLTDLVSETPLLVKLNRLATDSNRARANNLIKSLQKFRRPSSKRPKKKKTDPSKGKERATYEVHVHRMSLITKVQDLFPALGSAFIVKLLDEYNDDVEQATAHLLDGSLPSYLQQLDQIENLTQISDRETRGFTPRAIPSLPIRRNVFDNDEFDRLVVDSSRLHLGKSVNQSSADEILFDRTKTPSKAAILSALAAFDPDNDERDDTYDLEDVGGTVDATRPGVDEIDNDKDEQTDAENILFDMYQANQNAFQRDAATRRSAARQELKNSTGLSDEGIEGWAIMISRDPKRLSRLEAKYSSFRGQQRALKSTAWRTQESATEDSETSDADGARTDRGGRGRGRGRGRGGSVSGPNNDQGTQVARDRKKAHKDSRANHNRRDQRARKMARGGFAG